MKYIFFLLFSVVFVNVWFVQTDPFDIEIPEEEINEPDIYVPGVSYCVSRFPNNTSVCLSCFEQWALYDGNGCYDPCSNAFEGQTEKLQSCNEKLSACLDSGGSIDRCACKAIDGISLNTNVPFVGNCISLNKSSSSDTTSVTPTTAFPLLMAWLTRIVTTIILIFCFMAIIVGGVLMSMWWADESQHKKGKDLIKHVVIALALLWASGVILRIINPSFFG